MTSQTLTEHVCRIAEVIWGEHWRPQASDALDVDMRTLQHIKNAEKSGEESLHSGDVLARLEEFTVRVLKMVGSAHAALGGSGEANQSRIK
jgi:hypothetical protein